MENTLEIKIKIKFEKISNDSYMNFEYLTSILITSSRFRSLKFTIFSKIFNFRVL